jgi:cytochrome P450 family 2 subfamily S polypeptide 1
VPGGLPHAVKEGPPLQLGPYSVSHGHLLFGDFEALLKGDRWENGGIFDPDRFIGPDGKVERNENLIPFSVGKRICPGEGLARAEIFLFLVRLLQSFKFEAEDPSNPPDANLSKKGLTQVPLPFNARLTRC